jgi:AP-3 complex subunit beta
MLHHRATISLTASSLADTVKIQILNLGSKLYLTNPQQTSQLFDYILTLSKYDMSYDVRDKARVMRSMLFGTSNV